jgi:CO/xanthine dehydrogenase FAD-binding subunit
MSEFEILAPENIEECLDMLALRAPDARLIAGGTDLFVLIKARMTAPKCLISVGHIKGLGVISDQDGTVSIGSGLTHSEIAGLEILEGIPFLRKAARSVGSPQIRNAGTAGGNLANASPAADLYPPLLALDARLEMLRKGGKRMVRLEEFVRGPGMTAIMPDEIIGSIVFTKPEAPFYAGHEKVGLRNALAVSVTSTSVLTRAESGRFKDVRVACGAVAPAPIRMPEVERLVEGEAPSKELFEEARAVASTGCDPITDIRATRRYRRRVTGAVVSRLLRKAAGELMGHGGA